MKKTGMISLEVLLTLLLIALAILLLTFLFTGHGEFLSDILPGAFR